MGLNKAVFLLEDTLIDRINKHHAEQAGRGQTMGESVTELIDAALDYIVTGLTGDPVPGTVFAPSKLPLTDEAIAQIADLAASSGIPFDMCLAHVVAEGLNYFSKKQEDTNALIDEEGSAHAELESRN